MQCILRLEEIKIKPQELIHLLAFIQDQKITRQVTLVRLAIIL